jgi:multisubunit Na+/H+ antiporter MnhF subunit
MTIDLCPYKYIIGKPGEGVHSYRLFDIAMVDVIVTLIFAYIFATYNNYNFYEITIILFLLGIISHRLFCVRTTIDKLLFP